MSKKSDLMQLINEKLAEAKARKKANGQAHRPGRSVVREGKKVHGPERSVVRDETKSRTKSKPSTRAEINKKNAQDSTGPKSEAGKARSSANSLRHGFYANVYHLHPNDSPLYNQTLDDLRMGLHPDGPAEEHMIRDLAMLSARLKRLEAMEYALAMANIEAPPKLIKDPYDDFTPPTPQIDARDLTESYLKSLDQIERLSKIETHLRRAYNRTWERLERMQKERKKLPLDQMLKQTQIWGTYEALRNNQPERVPAKDPRIDEKGKLITYPKNHPMWRPKKGEQDDEKDQLIDEGDEKPE